jgi:type VI secretion system protein ImpA
MSAEANLDFPALLTPIEGAAATGADLRNDQTPSSVYDKIREARMLARDAERRADQGFDGAGGGLAAWRTIVETAPPILATQSKDLEIAAMLTEGLVRFHGFAGLRDGLRLIRELVETFWDGLYPVPDEDGPVARILPVISLNGEDSDGTLIQPLQRIAITDGGEPGPYNLAQYEQAQDLARVQDDKVRQQRIASGVVAVETIGANATQTPHPFYIALWGDVNGGIEEHRKLYETLDRVCGSDAPSGKRIGEILAKARDALLALAPFLAQVDQPAAAAQGETPQADAATAAARAVSGALGSREDAFALLLRVAEYFRRSEPQSTVPYVLEELVRRARLPLPQLLEELIQDENARRQFLVSAGIKPIQNSG